MRRVRKFRKRVLDLSAILTFPRRDKKNRLNSPGFVVGRSWGQRHGRAGTWWVSRPGCPRIASQIANPPSLLILSFAPPPGDVVRVLERRLPGWWLGVSVEGRALLNGLDYYRAVVSKDELSNTDTVGFSRLSVYVICKLYSVRVRRIDDLDSRGNNVGSGVDITMPYTELCSTV